MTLTPPTQSPRMPQTKTTTPRTIAPLPSMKNNDEVIVIEDDSDSDFDDSNNENNNNDNDSSGYVDNVTRNVPNTMINEEFYDSVIDGPARAYIADNSKSHDENDNDDIEMSRDVR